MKKKIIWLIIFTAVLFLAGPLEAQNFTGVKPDNPAEEATIANAGPAAEANSEGVVDPATVVDPAVAVDPAEQYDEYTIGVDDILEINVIQPEEISNTVTVSPDGFIFFPYIGGVNVEGMTLREVQEEVVERLSDGYMKYPVVFASLVDSRSRKFFVYGEVKKPGTYQLATNTTVLRAISMAGGFTKFGSSSRVRILRPRGDEPGYNNIRVNIKRVMVGDPDADMLLQSGDIIVISEGIF